MREEGADNAYKAIQVVEKSTNYFIELVNGRTPTITFYFPIIVIDSPLYEAKLKPDNEIELNEVNSITYIGRSIKGNAVFSIIDIVTKETVVTYSNILMKEINCFIADNLEIITEFLNNEYADYSASNVYEDREDD
ncbi:hypothetical protein KTO58_03350 [Chitinophaga pendula]|uniref:hypothetical protein n=1 Tax=Chitinophaga TaxID=79328 RepID=UPI000BB063F6|nr:MULTISPECIES: hypothetical protein [Chitinophaga]ASZ14130.1 hypothetical protein CK934_25865 [Chitinophaga sp. MD30]UCJ08236.1 hypothetical protein KTO58_03350 [Chitinophaga pendula]